MNPLLAHMLSQGSRHIYRYLMFHHTPKASSLDKRNFRVVPPRVLKAHGESEPWSPPYIRYSESPPPALQVSFLRVSVISHTVWRSVEYSIDSRRSRPLANASPSSLEFPLRVPCPRSTGALCAELHRTSTPTLHAALPELANPPSSHLDSKVP